MATNLQFIKSASASNTNSFSITDCFSANYDVYQIIVTDTDQSSSGGSHNNISFINSSGSEVTDAIYTYAQQQLKSYSSFGEDKYINQRYIRIMSQFTGASSVGAKAEFYIYNPFDSSSYTFALGQSSGFYETAGLLGTKAIGVLKQTSSITGLKFFTETTGTTYESIKVSIYGVK